MLFWYLFLPSACGAALVVDECCVHAQVWDLVSILLQRRSSYAFDSSVVSPGDQSEVVEQVLR